MELKIPKRLQQAKSEQKSARKAKTSGPSKGAKYVLFLGDEGAILIYFRHNAVLSRQFVPDASDHNLGELNQTLLKDPNAPILLAIDSMDQSFMQQTLPPVSVVSVNKLIKRRLERDFAGNDIKGAILLGREKSGRRDWNFLMVALEKSPQLAVWLNFIQELPNRFQGIYLASVESELLVKSLDRALSDTKSGDSAEWKLLVSHNKVGGFRQVIMRNGRIIFTRLAQPIGDSNVEVMAGGIEQEMLSTIEYMKRLSFSPQHKLDVYIITSGAIKAAIDRNKFSVNAFHILTPYEVAGYLGVEGAAQPTDQFGDVVMAASVALSKKHVLKLTAPQIRRIDQCYQYIFYVRIVAAASVLGILGYAAYVGAGILSLAEENAELTQKHNSMQSTLSALRQSIKDSKLDVEKASDLIDLYAQINKEKASPLPFLRKFEALSRAPVWITGLEWSIGDGTSTNATNTPPKAPPPPRAPAGTTSINAVVKLEFPQEASDPKRFRTLTKKILSDFREQFAGYEVNYLSLPDDSKESEKLEIRSGAAQEVTIKSLEAKMSITGPLLMENKEEPKAAKMQPAIVSPVTPAPVIP